MRDIQTIFVKESKDQLLSMIRDGKEMSRTQQVRLALLLAVPAILAQLSTVLLQYIDAAMVGHLGANPSASIGLISTSTWLFTGFCMAVMQGFCVQIAHLCGAGRAEEARATGCKGLLSVGIFAGSLSIIGLAISNSLPGWLGGSPEILDDAASYFRIYILFMPFTSIGYASSMMLQASGNMKVPSFVYVSMNVLDVVFNYIFIYMLDMGVQGAAIGTGVAQSLASCFAIWYMLANSRELNIRGRHPSWIPEMETLRRAWKITGPMWLQNVIMRGAYIMCTVIVAPLGAVAIAANTFAIIAESFCYMPAQGLSDAATTLVGQSLGAGRKDSAGNFAWICTGMAVAIVTLLAIVLYVFAPFVMGLLSSDPGVVELGAKVLRIEAFAELMYAVSIVGYGACVGGGDTLVPSAMNLCSIWAVRIGLALFLAPKMGLTGYWIAMCIELNIRGLLFILRIRGKKWMKLDMSKAV